MPQHEGVVVWAFGPLGLHQLHSVRASIKLQDSAASVLDAHDLSCLVVQACTVLARLNCRSSTTWYPGNLVR